MAAEFEKARIELAQHLQRASEGYQLGSTEYSAAVTSSNTMREAREKMYQEVLEQRGFAVCSRHERKESFSNSDISDNHELTLEEAGIFPKDEMRIYLSSKYFYNQGQDPGGASWGMATSIDLLCPTHYPEGEDRVIPPPDGGKGRERGFENISDTFSEVKNIDGKLIVQVNEKDITDDVKRWPWFRVSYLGPIHPSEDVYKVLKIPSLPTFPDREQVQRGELDLNELMGAEKVPELA